MTPSAKAKPVPDAAVIAQAKVLWDADRAQLRRESPDWEMPAWSRARAWRRRPYINAAICGATMAERDAA